MSAMDMKKLLRFCKSLSYVTGIRINLIYPDGRIFIARGRKKEDICYRVLVSPEVKEVCRGFLKEIPHRIGSEEGCVEFKCALGMGCVGFSFDELEGISFVLCCYYDRDSITRSLEGLGFNPESVERMVKETVPIPIAKLREAANILRAVAAELHMEWRTKMLTDELERSNQMLKAKVMQMELLNKITSLVQKDIELDRRLFAILTCITAGHGLGFNRAFLFLSNEDGDKLIGEMAIGPSSLEEAYKIWDEVSKIPTLDQIIDAGVISDSETNRKVKGVEVDIDPEDKILYKALIERRPVIWRSKEEDPNKISKILEEILGPTDECVIVPLIARGKVIGAIVADNIFNRVPISQEAVDLLTAFCDHAAMAIDTSRLYSEIKDALLKERAVYEFGLMASSTFELDPLLSLLVKKAAEVVSADGAIIRVLDPGGKLRVATTYGIGEKIIRHEILEIGEGLAGICALQRKPIIACDISEKSPECPSYFAIHVPLISKEDIVGTMAVYLSSTGGMRKVKDEDIRTLTILAAQAATAIENIKLYENLQEKIRELEEAGNYIREQAVKMAEKEKMSALGEMIAVVAHELRNPLVSIGGFVRIVDRKVKANEPIKPYMGIIMDEVSRLERIIANMLDYANPSPPFLKPSDLNEIVRKATMMMLHKAHEKGIVLSCYTDPSIPQIMIDPDQIYQVVINLIENAINILESLGGAIEVRTYFKDEKAVLEVEDTGPGIPEDILPKIFEPFFTTRARGTGLGLHVTKRIVEDHNGEIEIKSEVGKGTIFSIKLPMK